MKKKIVLISGKIHNGKNKFADYFTKCVQTLNNTSVGQDLFAGTLKDWCREDFVNLINYLYKINKDIKENILLISNVQFVNPTEVTKCLQKVENSLNELIIKDENWYEKKNQITRNILQIVGTNLFRNRVNENWWVEQLKNRCKNSDKDVILITDVRFPSEVYAFEDEVKSGIFDIITIRVNRNINTNESIANHESETALDNFTDWSYIVDNNGNLEDLKNSVETIVNDIFKEKIT